MQSKDTQNKDIINEIKIVVSNLKIDMGYLKHSIDDIILMLEKNFVRRDELTLTNSRLALLERIVFGVVYLIIIAVVGAALSFIIIKK